MKTFSKGGHSTKSNGIDRRKNEYRTLLKKAISNEDFTELIEVVKTKARNGCIKSIQLLFEYTLGRPTQSFEIDQPQDEQLNEIIVTIVRNEDEAKD